MEGFSHLTAMSIRGWLRYKSESLHVLSYGHRANWNEHLTYVHG